LCSLAFSIDELSLASPHLSGIDSSVVKGRTGTTRPISQSAPQRGRFSRFIREKPEIRKALTEAVPKLNQNTAEYNQVIIEGLQQKLSDSGWKEPSPSDVKDLIGDFLYDESLNEKKSEKEEGSSSVIRASKENTPSIIGGSCPKPTQEELEPKAGSEPARDPPVTTNLPNQSLASFSPAQIPLAIGSLLNFTKPNKEVKATPQNSSITSPVKTEADSEKPSRPIISKAEDLPSTAEIKKILLEVPPSSALGEGSDEIRKTISELTPAESLRLLTAYKKFIALNQFKLKSIPPPLYWAWFGEGRALLNQMQSNKP